MVLGGSSDVYRKEGVYGGSARKDGRRVIAVITSSAKKRAEVEELLGEKYGCNVVFIDGAAAAPALTNATTPTAVQSEEAVAAVRDLAAKWDVANTSSPQFVLREHVVLCDLRSHCPIDPDDIVANPDKYKDKLLEDRSFLAVWKLSWDNETGKLDAIQPRWFEHAAHGFVDPARKGETTADVFGWDAIFVVPQLGKTYQELKQASPCGKIASRQLTLSSFTAQYLLYEKPKGLTHNKELANVARAVQFDAATSVARFVGSNVYLNNPHRRRWALDKFTTHVLNDGIFFRAAASRPMGNFFSPPLGGVPLTTKKDAVEETVFMQHDIGHQHIPDLIYCGEDFAALPEDERRAIVNVYCIWRMLSEATTMMLADCLYASTLAETDAAFVPCLDKRIYPLWCRLQPRITDNGGADRLTTMKRLLWANAAFALVGDRSEFEKFLDTAGDEKDKAALDAFVAHFERFFVGDHIWSEKNFACMRRNHNEYKAWHDEIVGDKGFERAGLPRIADVVAALRTRKVDCSGTLDKQLVRHVWEYLVDTRIAPIFGSDDEIAPLAEQQRISKGFYRYMIGQLYFYARFGAVLPGLKERGRRVMVAIDAATDGGNNTAAMSPEAIDAIQTMYHNDVRYVWSMGLISSASCEEYMQMHPIFEPVYVSYYSLPHQHVSETLAAIHPPRKQ